MGDKELGIADYPQRRTDVAANFPEYGGSDLCGFEIRLPSSETIDTQPLRVALIGQDGAEMKSQAVPAPTK